MRFKLLSLLSVLLLTSTLKAERLKGLADLEGVRPNQLIGYGLVVGLQGSGDDVSAKFSTQSLVNMLKRLGVHANAETLRLKNVAAVVVTAKLPAFVRPGHCVDVTISSIGNAKSLAGGTLLSAPLKGADLEVYAVAQGSLTVGGYNVSGSSGSSSRNNYTNVARIPCGAMVERAVTMDLAVDDMLRIALKMPDFTTAVRVATKIESYLGAKLKPRMPVVDMREVNKIDAEMAGTRRLSKRKRAEMEDTKKLAMEQAQKAHKVEMKAYEKVVAEIKASLNVVTRDPGTVTVNVPENYKGRIPVLMAELEILNVNPDIPTKVVVNERTGTVVLGDGVRISPVAIAHGGLTLEVQEDLIPSQPAPFSEGGETVIVPQTRIEVEEEQGTLQKVAPGAALSDVVEALNALGVSPRDLVTILQTLKASGALRAELEVL
jgi:flagellar P-ring protein precursor FlgI